MWGKTISGSSYAGVELAPNGRINVTLFDAGYSCVYLRQMNSANTDGSYYVQFLEHNGTEMASIRRRVYPNGVHLVGVTDGCTVRLPAQGRSRPGAERSRSGDAAQARHLHGRTAGGVRRVLRSRSTEVVPGAVVGEKDAVYTETESG